MKAVMVWLESEVLVAVSVLGVRTGNCWYWLRMRLETKAEAGAALGELVFGWSCGCYYHCDGRSCCGYDHLRGGGCCRGKLEAEGQSGARTGCLGDGGEC